MADREGQAQGRTRSLTLDEFASITAALGVGLPREEILAEAGLSLEAWDREQEKWLASLAGQAAEGRLSPSKRYLERVRAGQERAKGRKKPRKKPEGPMPGAPAPPVLPVVTRRDGTLATSAMRAPAPAAGRLPAPVQTAPPAAGEEGGTQMISLAELLKAGEAALPFAASDDDDATLQPTASPIRDGALPFARSLDDAATPPAAVSPVRDNALPFARPLDDTGGETQAPSPSPFRDKALPFAGAPAAAPPPPQEASSASWALPFQRAAAPAPAPAPAPPAPVEAPSAIRKMPVEVFAAVAASSEGTPPESFTLDQYANLCAGVRAHPTHVPWVRSRFGLTEDGWTALHVLWRERFLRDPSLQEQWQQMIAERLPYWKR